MVHIIDKLKLNITLHKVKAHSNNTFNDIADAQAKAGRLHQIPTSIKHQHLPSQTVKLISQSIKTFANVSE